LNITGGASYRDGGDINITTLGGWYDNTGGGDINISAGGYGSTINFAWDTQVPITVNATPVIADGAHTVGGNTITTLGGWIISIT
jgi:hypothetical protein